MTAKKIITAVIVAIMVLGVVSLCVCPDIAFAAETGKKSVSFSYIIGQLQTVVSVLLLPLSVMICAWRIIYIAVFAGIMGIDPLNMVSDTDRDGQVSGSEVVQAIKAHLSGFFHGLMWIGGLFIIFQLALTLAALLARTLAENF